MTGQSSIQKRTDYSIPPTWYTLVSHSAIPSVEGIDILLPTNVTPVTITNFLKGQEGQFLRILGDGNTTVANNANIITNTGANKLLLSNLIYTFTLIGNVWHESV